jgi:hypothetical protein
MAVTALLASMFIGAETNAAPPGLLTLLFMEFLGLRLIHAGIFGRNWRPKMPKPLEVLFGNVLFTVAGFYLFLRAWSGLGGLFTGPEWRIVVLLAYLGAAGTLEYRSWRRWRDAESWPTTMATIESKEVNQVQSGKSSHYFVAELAYSYSVRGEFYSGYYKRPFESEIGAWEFADSLTGKSVLIHYKPNNPAISILPDKVATAEAEALQKQHEA